MLVSKNIHNMRESIPQTLAIGDAVKILSIRQTGVVSGYRNGHWMVRLSEGSEIPCDRNNLEKRQFLAE